MLLISVTYVLEYWLAMINIITSMKNKRETIIVTKVWYNHSFHYRKKFQHPSQDLKVKWRHTLYVISNFPPVPKNKWSLILTILAYKIIPLMSPSVTVKLRKNIYMYMIIRR